MTNVTKDTFTLHFKELFKYKCNIIHFFGECIGLYVFERLQTEYKIEGLQVEIT